MPIIDAGAELPDAGTGAPKGPCQLWTTVEAVRACAPAVPDDVTDEQVELAVMLASQNLYRFAGRQYGGLCQDSVRPCVGVNCGMDGVVSLGAGALSGFRYHYPSLPQRLGREWENVSLCAGQKCMLPCVVLPGPVVSIDEVLVDGAVVDPSAYEISGYRKLCRTDGGKWPCGQDMSLPTTSVGTMQVDWTRGTPVDVVASQMATIYARRRLLPLICETGACGDVTDEGIDLMSADGVTTDFYDTNDPAGFMRTGIRIVDEWLDGINPKRRTRRMRIGRADNPARASRKFT
jgi:hypothetical protein